jgi:hypothetical protein
MGFNLFSTVDESKDNYKSRSASSELSEEQIRCPGCSTGFLRTYDFSWYSMHRYGYMTDMIFAYRRSFSFFNFSTCRTSVLVTQISISKCQKPKLAFERSNDFITNFSLVSRDISSSRHLKLDYKKRCQSLAII